MNAALPVPPRTPLFRRPASGFRAPPRLRTAVVVAVLGAVSAPFPPAFAATGQPASAPFTRVTTGPVATDLSISAEGSSADYDHDGDLDLLVTGLAPSKAAFYRNDGSGVFTRLTDTVALPFLALPDVAEAAWGDYDNDGLPDLAVMAGLNPTDWIFSQGRFFRNNGDGTFTPGPSIEVNSAWSMAWGDLNQDGFLDLVASQYDGNFPTLVLRNDGRGGFTRMTTNEVGALVYKSQKSGGACWADYDDDGRLDVMIPSTGTSMLFRNVGNGRFERSTVSGVRDTGLGPIAGAWGDYDNDGRLDLLLANVTYQAGQTKSLGTLYRNLGGGRFQNVTGSALPLLPGNQANAAYWADYDNDGFLDAYLTIANELLHNNGDGTFSRVPSGGPVDDTVPSSSASFSSHWFDYDNDGFPDLFVANGSDYAAGGEVNNFLYHNDGNANGWLKVRLVGTTSNRMGVGAKVRIRTTVPDRGEMWQRRDITAGSVYNGNQFEAHFGLGAAAKADLVRIEWPSGIVQELAGVVGRQALLVTEPERIRLGVSRINEGLAIECHGAPGTTYELQTTGDLRAWTTLGAVTTDATGLAASRVIPETNQGRFYRAVKK